MMKRKKKTSQKLLSRETAKIGHVRIQGLNLEADPVLDQKADQDLEQKADQDRDLALTDQSRDQGLEADPDQIQGRDLEVRLLKSLDQCRDLDQIVPAIEAGVDRDLVRGKQRSAIT